MSVEIKIDARDALREIDRLEKGLGQRDLLRLDGVLTGLFAQTQRAVHVRTGSLFASGKPFRIESQFPDNERFEGWISYGGASPGSVHDPVRYAAAERARGGDHDFMVPAYASEPEWERAIGEYMRNQP